MSNPYRFTARQRRALSRAVSSNVVPPWVLPFMRLAKGRAAGDMAEAWALLERHLPRGVPAPSVVEAAAVLAALRLVR